jgi:hypothetical protein
VIPVLAELQQLGYEAAVVEGRLRLTWHGPTPPIPAQVRPLLDALRHRKSAVLAALRCPWCEAAYAWAAPWSGRLYCESCHAVYNPAVGDWAPEASDRRRQTTAPSTSDRRGREATA